MPPPSRSDLEAEGVELIEERGQSLLLDSTVLVSGQVERTSSFEQGFAIHHAHGDHGWEPDPMIWDDQNLIVNVGLRFDLFQPNYQVPVDWTQGADTRVPTGLDANGDTVFVANRAAAKVKTQLSPRLGIAFPISSTADTKDNALPSS